MRKVLFTYTETVHVLSSLSMVPLAVVWVSGPVVSMDSVHIVACSDQHRPCWDKNGSGEVCDEEGDRDPV